MGDYVTEIKHDSVDACVDYFCYSLPHVCSGQDARCGHNTSVAPTPLRRIRLPSAPFTRLHFWEDSGLRPETRIFVSPQDGCLATIRIYDHRKTRPRFPDVHDKNPPQLSPVRVLRGRAAACAATLLTALGCGCRSRMFDPLLFRFAWSPASFLFRCERARHGIAVLGLGACIFGHG